MRAAFWGVVSALAVSFLTRVTRPSLRGLEKALLGAGSGAVQVAAACAAAGVVVGVASLTGIGLRMSELIITLSQGSLFLALLLTAMGSIILGMGLPTTAAYVVLAALGAPALIQLGVPILAAHLFIFYFGCISNVTPPVSLAAYAASGIAGSPPLKTAWTAMVLAFAGFLVPFMFVYGPALLLMGSVVEIGLVVATQKYRTLQGMKLAIVQPLDESLEEAGVPVIAVDPDSRCGLGELVYYVGGGDAAILELGKFIPSDASIVGIIDRVDVEKIYKSLPGGLTEYRKSSADSS